LKVLQGWDDHPEDIDLKVPPLIEVEPAREYHLHRDKAEKSGLTPMMILAVVAVILGGIGLMRWTDCQGLEKKREASIQTAQQLFLDNEIEAYLKALRTTRKELHLFEWTTRGKIHIAEGLAHLERDDREKALKAYGQIADLPFQAEYTEKVAEAGLARFNPISTRPSCTTHAWSTPIRVKFSTTTSRRCIKRSMTSPMPFMFMRPCWRTRTIPTSSLSWRCATWSSMKRERHGSLPARQNHESFAERLFKRVARHPPPSRRCLKAFSV
jgi:hypothetical protein